MLFLSIGVWAGLMVTPFASGGKTLSNAAIEPFHLGVVVAVLAQAYFVFIRRERLIQGLKYTLIAQCLAAVGVVFLTPGLSE